MYKLHLKFIILNVASLVFDYKYLKKVIKHKHNKLLLIILILKLFLL